MDKRFWIILILILIVAASIRLPGIRWQQGINFNGSYSLHPDEMTFVKDANRFNKNSLSGYVRGFTAHIYIVKTFIEKILKKNAPLVQISRLISFTYGLLCLVLVAIMVSMVSGSPGLGLITSSFLALAPLHIMYSHIGVADSTVIFYYYLSLFLGWLHLKTKSEAAYVLFCVSMGICIAVKFFISLFVPLAILIISGERKIYKCGLAMFVLAGSFSIANFFNYSPWDFRKFIEMLAYDNVVVTAGNTLLGNVIFYLWSIPSSVGLGNIIFIIIGVTTFIIRCERNLLIKTNMSNSLNSFKRLIRNPNSIILSGLIVQFVLVIRMGISANRHSLFLIPLVCFLAAMGFQSFCSILKRRKSIVFIVGLVVFSYQTYNAVGVELIYLNDIRENAVKWLDSRKIDPNKVTAYMGYSRFRPEYSHSEDLDGCYYFVTCDLEYGRYFISNDANKIFHAYGGQKRLKFFRDLFSNKLNFRIVQEFKQKKYTLEQLLIGFHILLPLDTYTSHKCIIFQRIKI